MEKQLIKTNKGITLIALVITVIVLLILAGVSIAMLTGENGIIKKAQEAKKKTEIAQILENIQIDILNEEMEKDITQEKLEQILGKYGEVQYDGENGNITGLKINSIDEIIPIKEIYEGEFNEEIVDTTAPTITIELGSTSTTVGMAIMVTVKHIDNESGVDIAKCRYIYNTTSDYLGINNTIWNTANSFYSENEDIPFSDSGIGTYYLHVLSVDIAGNKTEKISDSITVTSPINTFSFTIDGEVYKAEEGMTWGEWVESYYNTTDLLVANSGMISEDIYVDFGGTPEIGTIIVTKDDEIIEEKVYDNFYGYITYSSHASVAPVL